MDYASHEVPVTTGVRTVQRPPFSARYVLLAFAFLLQLQLSPVPSAVAAGEIMICNYEKFNLFDSMYRPRTEQFCVFSDVYLGPDVKGTDFLASSLDYKRVAFTNSKFTQVPPSLFKNFDDIRELYVRRCSLESLKVTRQLEKVYAGGNRIASVQLDGNASNSLRELYLDGNRMRALANLTNLPNLEVLVLENNPLLGDVDLAQFERMEHLWKLDLERIGMTKVQNGLQRPLAALKRLDLSNNALTYVHVRMFRTFPRLEHLWLHGNRLYFLEADQLPLMMPSVRSIVIDDNYWGCGHLAVLGQQLRDRGIVIRHGECRTRAVHRVCCSDVTEVVDFRYIIEMGVRREGRLEQDLRELRTVTGLLRQDLERLRHRMGELSANLTNRLTGPATTDGDPDQAVSKESSAVGATSDGSAEESYEEDSRTWCTLSLSTDGELQSDYYEVYLCLLSQFYGGLGQGAYAPLTRRADQPTVHNVAYDESSRQWTANRAVDKYSLISCKENVRNYDCLFKDVHIDEAEEVSLARFGDYGKPHADGYKSLAFDDSTVRRLSKELLATYPRIILLNLQDLQLRVIDRDAFRYGGQLQQLYLGFNSLFQLERGVFNELRALGVISLNQNRISYLPEGLFTYNSMLFSVAITNNALTRIEDRTFTNNPHLQNVNVSSNSIEYFDLSLLTAAYEIDVSYNRLTQVKIPARLERLFASNNHIERIMANGVNGELKELHLSNNKLTNIDWVLSYPALEVLNLAHNEIEDVKKGQLQTRKLKKLLLNNNRLFSFDLTNPVPKELRILDLSHNQLTYVEQNTKLFDRQYQLYLHNNDIVKLKLSANNSLQNVTLSNNDWDCAYHDRLLEQIRMNSEFARGNRIQCDNEPQAIVDIDELNKALQSVSSVSPENLRHEVNELKSIVTSQSAQKTSQHQELYNLKQMLSNKLPRYGGIHEGFDTPRMLADKLLSRLEDRKRLRESQTHNGKSEAQVKETERDDLKELIASMEATLKNKKAANNKMKQDTALTNSEINKLKARLNANAASRRIYA
ncbi:uncharacterized protein LOC118464559 [Anopheles albimanus]|uniref:uncharacterized protein LOC118464559 n=1 Tax=Anopheles albimanus TaxID=7167 RepID=UPI00163FEE6F|nr:uncharacterized protein LOC118464559 [Anopheles albimanus]